MPDTADRAPSAAAPTGRGAAAPAPDPLTPGTAAAMPPVAGTLIERMQITIDHVDAREARGSMPVEGNTQPYGLLHGGASAVLAETLGSYAAQVHAGAGRAAVGVELSATHHRSARAGTVRGTATALHLGRSLATYQVVVEDADGRRLCTARLTCMLVDATG